MTFIQSMCIIINKSRRYLSWIEGLTTNQNVIAFESYTPHQLNLKASGNGGFSFAMVEDRIDSNMVKVT